MIKLGKTQESLPWFEQALELEPDNTDVISCPDN
ncbi:MAG: tetratricopeptide repeat protein [Okeania sp. SIO2C2]|nr:MULTISPECIES: tetratricopeptide repeat protein [unclassified Okeania]NEP71118.1 tetratricopeptide repeat protein [Okeania sp. SIO2G5]NEP85660.1 tetratricopeptide repeat protein [Okeania sp. SIO2C2]NEP92032.1 tetratricopeptide repeat protein [Okeania sp. SIO2F5]NEQ90147.1 tetratricopeptide repeat protein [Okeania sp. SIO2G4]